MIGVTLVAACAARIIVGDWQLTDALVPAVMLAAFPFLEWMVHVLILHWRPRHVGALTIDPLLAREHRRHHVDPRSIPLIFIPWKALLWVMPLALVIALLAFPRVGLGLSYHVLIAVLALDYEWTHYLIHSDYKPISRVYKAIWRNHRSTTARMSITGKRSPSSGTADRVLGTYPDPATTPTSPTAKSVHAERV